MSKAQRKRLSVSYWHLDAQGRPLDQAKKRVDRVVLGSTGLVMFCPEFLKPRQLLGFDVVMYGLQEKRIQCVGEVIRLALNPNGELEIFVAFKEIGSNHRELYQELDAKDESVWGLTPEKPAFARIPDADTTQ